MIQEAKTEQSRKEILQLHPVIF